MQLSYNNQSLLAAGCYEAEDPGITRMGKQVIREMNRVGMVIDMSHSADRSTIEAADLSQRPIAITHANPYNWCPALRKQARGCDPRRDRKWRHDRVFSLYPHHLLDKTACRLESFCAMIADTAARFGVAHLGAGNGLVSGSAGQRGRMDACGSLVEKN